MTRRKLPDPPPKRYRPKASLACAVAAIVSLALAVAVKSTATYADLRAPASLTFLATIFYLAALILINLSFEFYNRKRAESTLRYRAIGTAYLVAAIFGLGLAAFPLLIEPWLTPIETAFRIFFAAVWLLAALVAGVAAYQSDQSISN